MIAGAMPPRSSAICLARSFESDSGLTPLVWAPSLDGGSLAKIRSDIVGYDFDQQLMSDWLHGQRTAFYPNLLAVRPCCRAEFYSTSPRQHASSTQTVSSC